VTEGVSAQRPAGLPAALRGVLWMVGALLSFSTMAVSVRELLDTMGTFEVLFFRSLVSLAMVLALVPRYGFGALRTHRFGLHLVRNLLHFCGQFAWVYAIAFLPLATVFAIEFTMPVWTAVLAVLLLHERLNAGRVAMLVLGIAGILIILRPGFAFIHPAALVMLGGSLAFASTMITTKSLSSTDAPIVVLFYMSVIQLPLGLLPALPHWVTPTAADLPWIAGVGVAGYTAHYCMTRAFRLADATLVVPIDFLRLPLIAAVGAVFYNEPVQLVTMLGATVMFVGIYLSVSRESRRRPVPAASG